MQKLHNFPSNHCKLHQGLDCIVYLQYYIGFDNITVILEVYISILAFSLYVIRC